MVERAEGEQIELPADAIETAHALAQLVRIATAALPFAAEPAHFALVLEECAQPAVAVPGSGNE